MHEGIFDVKKTILRKWKRQIQEIADKRIDSSLFSFEEGFQGKIDAFMIIVIQGDISNDGL